MPCQCNCHAAECLDYADMENNIDIGHLEKKMKVTKRLIIVINTKNHWAIFQNAISFSNQAHINAIFLNETGLVYYITNIGCLNLV